MHTANQFSGIYPMMFALFDAGGRLDRSATQRQVQACLRGGAHGVAVLGLATEVSKLAAGERRQLVEWVISEVDGRVPVAVTVAEPTVSAQVSFAAWAKERGASWVILQPPPERGLPEPWYADFFARVMTQLDMPCAIQNAPEYIGVGLGAQSIRSLRERCPNFVLLKGEGSVIAIREILEAVHGELTVFNGRGGLELTDNLRAGCAGMIPAADTFDYQVRIFELLSDGRASHENKEAAEEIYRKILPAIVFSMQSLDSLICYGKRIAALRLGLSQVYDRLPAMLPTEFGAGCVRRYAEMLGPLA